MILKPILKSLILAGFIGLGACSGGDVEKVEEATVIEPQGPVSLADVINDARRAEHKARDQFRHPQETLEFFEVGPGKKVAEIWPGWYTNILAPYLKENDGQYVAALFNDAGRERYAAWNAEYKTQYGDSDIYGDIEYTSFMPAEGPFLPAASVDTILTFRNVHNWMGNGYADKAFAEFYAALKPGGILGVVEHRLPESAVQNPDASTGYVQQSYMKDLAKRAGFEFVASSEINANPRDTADHPMGVWTLQPRLAQPKEGSEAAKDFKAELYKNIGESDRATLKFRKPL